METMDPDFQLLKSLKIPNSHSSIVDGIALEEINQS